MSTALRTLVWLVAAPSVLIFCSACAALLGLLGAGRHSIDRWYRGLARACLWLSGANLSVEGAENIVPDQAYVIVPNHESNLDPLAVLVATRPASVRFVVKRQLMAIPVFGHALRWTGNVRVDRSNTARDLERIREGMESRGIEVSLLFYAEGNRSRRGALQNFKRGAFATAINHSLPVLPIGHAGTFSIWRPESAIMRKGHVHVAIGEPIPTDSLKLADRSELSERTREAVRALRTRARERVRERGWDPGGVD